MPKLFMLIGVPGSGKSTWLRTMGLDKLAVLSTDDKIEAAAIAQGKTYNDVFKSEIAAAEKQMYKDAETAFATDRDVIWDQTNITAKTRSKKLRIVPKHYDVVAVYFETPDDIELKRRLDSRVGKTIPANIVMGMKSQLEEPNHSEGFGEIIYANNH